MSQIRVFNKSYLDQSIDGVTITAADDEATNTGQDFVNLLRDRKNNTGWATSGSSDSATCTLEAEFAAGQEMDTVILVDHNFKSYDLHYWTGVAWVLIESITNNTDTTTYHFFTAVTAYKIRLTITATLVADDDKFLAQLIATDVLSSGQFEGYPEIRRVKHKTNKRITKMLSGKALVVEGVGASEFELRYKLSKSDSDLSLIEAMYDNRQGFLVWISGGTETQFSTLRKGYRNKDIYFMRAMDDYSDDFYKSVYSAGTVVKIKLREAVL
jgi:hypothetical protein